MNKITRILLTIVTVLLATSLLAEEPRQRYIIILKQRSGAMPDVAALGGTIESRQEDQLVVTISAASLAALRSDPKVRYIERVGGDASDAGDALIGVPSDPAPGPASKPRLTPIALGTTSWGSGEYKYDGAGNIISIGTDNYLYDSVQRLKQSSTRGVAETYTYDGFGNMTAKTNNGSSQPIPSVQTATNRYTGGDYTYNAIGAMSKKYNNDSSTQEYYLYTPGDERIGVQRGSWWTWSVRDEGGKVLRQYRSSTTNPSAPSLWLEDFVWRDGLLLGSQRPPEMGGRRHYHLDHLGTPRLVTADNGQRISAHDYFPFGDEATVVWQEVAAGFDREDPLKFTGHERDYAGGMGGEDGHAVDYMHARYYSPTLGRFLSFDPLGGNPYRPQTWNRYAYALNNPVIYTDPSGLYPCMVLGSDGKEHPGECVDVISHNDVDRAEWEAYRQNHKKNLIRSARAGDDFAALQLNFSREIHNPLYATNIEATYAEFALVAPLTGFLRQIGTAAGEIGVKAAAEEAGSFFDGATFNLSGKLDPFHNFPESVMAFEDAGTVSTIRSAGGTTSQMLEIPGGYMGKEGVFQFIKTNMNEITHYLFSPFP
jgi:RHS repeat-associated protein